MKIYSIKNEKLNFFNRPIYCENDAEALSYIQNVLMSDADRALLGLKNDLALYFIGDFNSSSGIIQSAFDFVGEDVIKVADLIDIFETIPNDKIPRTERAIKSVTDNLQVQIDKLCRAIDTLSVDKKGNVTHE